MILSSRYFRVGCLFGGFFLALLGLASSAQANVYATNIKLNSSITNDITVALGSSVTINYVLNEPASLGVIVNIVSGTTILRSIRIPADQPGAARGANSVLWDGKTDNGTSAPIGDYAISITAKSSGYTNWTQITRDNTDGTHADETYVWEGRGIAVDRNANSPYYGRVFVSNASANAGSRPGDQVGILKLNADASPADEGIFSTGGRDWAGDLWSPWHLEVSDDDFVYINDWTSSGEVFRWDPTLATATQLQVIRPDNWATNEVGFFANMSGPAVFGKGTNTSIWMADNNSGDLGGSFGVLKYVLDANGTAATNDPGTTVVKVGESLKLSAYDVALDKDGNIYTIQHRATAGDDNARVFRFPAYNPSTNSGNAELQADWAIGVTNDTMGGATGIAVDPSGTYVAVAFRGIFQGFERTNGCTQIFYATNGALVTNLDLGINLSGNITHQDTDCAWDAVGNVYYIDNIQSAWRAVSPPGTNQATTVAVPKVRIAGISLQPPHIDNIELNGTTVTITFTADPADSPATFKLFGSPAVAASYTEITNATISKVASGQFQAVVSLDGTTQFYRIVRTATQPPLQAPHMDNIEVTGSTVTIRFTADAGDSPASFTLWSAPTVAASYTEITNATISTVAPGQFQAVVSVDGPVRFYRIRR